MANYPSTEKILLAPSYPTSLGVSWKGLMKLHQSLGEPAPKDGASSSKRGTHFMDGITSQSKHEAPMKNAIKFETYNQILGKFVPVKGMPIKPHQTVFFNVNYKDGEDDEALIQLVIEHRDGMPRFTISLATQGQYALLAKGRFATMKKTQWLPRGATAQIQLYKKCLRDVVSHFDEAMRYVIDFGGQKNNLRCRCGAHKLGPDSLRNCGTLNATMDRARTLMSL